MINPHESMKPGWDRTRDYWICSQTHICSQTRDHLHYAARLSLLSCQSNKDRSVPTMRVLYRILQNQQLKESTTYLYSSSFAHAAPLDFAWSGCIVYVSLVRILDSVWRWCDSRRLQQGQSSCCCLKFCSCPTFHSSLVAALLQS